MAAAMSFDQAPPLSVPLRFFLTAPLFGCAAGLLVALLGSDLLASRWSGPALAVTHLLTLGFMLQAMVGASLQVLPVAIGANVWRPRVTATVTHVGLTAGTLMLVGGFLFEAPILFRLAVPMLVAALAMFIAAVGRGLFGGPASGDTVTAMRAAFPALALTALVGAMLATAFGWGNGLPLMLLTDLHAAWGLVGWGLLLLAGVSFLVVPMFQLTPPYKSWIGRRLPLGLAALLVAWSVAVAAGDVVLPVRDALAVLLGLAAAGFAAETLRLQRLRRRKHVDASFLFWRTAMLALIVAVGLVLVLTLAGELPGRTRIEIALGLAVLGGFYVSVINGMCYKIVPFITWLHLQGRIPSPPNMNQILPETAATRQLWAHWAALAALGIGLLFAPSLILGGLLFAVSCAWLEFNLYAAARLYRRLIRSAPA
jgi:hypothetical protein